MAWTLYDFANTSFAVIVVTVVFAVYFKKYIVGDFQISFLGLQRNPGDLLWGLSGAFSMFLVGISSPVAGAMADCGNKKKAFMIAYSLLCISCTMALYLLRPGMIWQAMVLFILGNFAFEGALVFYNGFLPQLAPPERIGRISGYGFALGYVGSLVCLLIALPYANAALAAGDLALMRPAFILAGIFFLTFSLPFFFLVHEKEKRPEPGTGRWSLQGWQRTLATLKQVKKFPRITRFMVAYFVYIDGVNTIIYFSGIYASDSLGFSIKEVILFFAVVQTSAIAGAYFFGILTDRLGALRTIKITLLIWMVVVMGGSASHDKLTFYLVGLLAGIAVGSCQSASRALMGSLIPAGMEAEFFGFYALVGKFSAILGPLVFGLVSLLTSSQRWAVLSVGIFFAGGYLLLNRAGEKIPG